MTTKTIDFQKMENPMTRPTPEIEFAGYYLLDRGYSYPKDFTPETAIEKASFHILAEFMMRDARGK